MTDVKERLEQMRRTGAAAPARVAAPAVTAGVSARARRYAGSAEHAPEIPPPAADARTAVPSEPVSSTPAAVSGTVPAAAPARSRLERFGSATSIGQGAQSSRPGPRSIIAEGAPLAPAPQPGQETRDQAQIVAHCMEMWAQTPQRECDRELVLHAAAWYERTVPWALSGVHAMVVSALDLERQQQVSAPTGKGNEGRRPGEKGAAPDACPGHVTSTRASRYARERG